jgi:transcription antitermination factor NusG
MAGAIDFVSFGNDPATVPDELIHKIKLRVDIINNVSNEGFGGLKPGVPIIIRDGLFDGYEAIIDSRLSGTKRVRVLLEILKGRQFRLELPVTQIEPMKRF